MPRKPAADPAAAAETVAAVAAQYDNEEGDLQRAARARLAYRLARSGKECARCTETKPLRDFSLDSRARDALSALCRSCIRERDARAKAARAA